MSVEENTARRAWGCAWKAEKCVAQGALKTFREGNFPGDLRFSVADSGDTPPQPHCCALDSVYRLSLCSVALAGRWVGHGTCLGS